MPDRIMKNPFRFHFKCEVKLSELLKIEAQPKLHRICVCESILSFIICAKYIPCCCTPSDTFGTYIIPFRINIPFQHRAINFLWFAYIYKLFQIAEKNKGESSSNNPAAGGGTGAGVAGNLKPILSSAAAKRAQFLSSRGTETLTSVERERPRPPLVRAMSAPIRPLDDSMKQLQNKRKARRRKNFRDRDDILELDEDELNDSSNNKNNKNRKPPPPRTRSALGCDIETLVSLLSSGGSDSEKEESSPNKNELLKVRTPMLRKTGERTGWICGVFLINEIQFHSFISRE